MAVVATAQVHDYTCGMTGRPLEETPELQRWVIAQTEAGHTPDALLEQLKVGGWPEDQAVAVVTRALESRLAELRAKNAAASASVVGGGDTLPAAGAGDAGDDAPTALHVPQPFGLSAPPAVRALDREVKVLFTLPHPRVILFGGLLSNTECDELVTLSRARMTASQVVDADTGGEIAHEGRTSSGFGFARGTTPLIDRIERRIAALLKWPLEFGEGLQILRYRVGQEYRPHHDYMDPALPGAAAFLARGGQRVATLVMYLNTPLDGGATNFPDIGLEVAAQKGNAVFFSYDRPHPSTRTLHGGMPVLNGEKWVATKWLRVARHH
jgi:prolyl 4-hydroxylase